MIPDTQARSFLFVLLLLISAGCSNEVVVHQLEEREANKIIELLAESEIASSKTVVEGRKLSYNVSVAKNARVDAIRLLNEHELPRRTDVGYQELYSEGGLIPTATEERAKHLAALEGEIEKQLRIIDGVLDVQVQLVMPEENALRTGQEVRPTTTASVTLKYYPGPSGIKPLSEPQIQAIVSAGVERLTPENVIVVMTPSKRFKNKEDAPKGPEELPTLRVFGMSSRTLYYVLLSLFSVVLLFGGFLIITQIRLMTVRSRLLRLQEEIVKAKRKVTDSKVGLPTNNDASQELK